MVTFLKKKLAESSRLLGLDFLIKVSNQGLLLPFYHTVSDRDLLHIKHLYPITSVKRFNEDLDFFQKTFKPVSHKYLLESVENKSLRKEKTFFLSFDDGLREFHDVVAPILKNRGIPACCFVNSGFVDNKDMFFRMKASILIEKILKKDLTLGQKNFIVEIFEQNELKYQKATDLLKINDANKHILDTLAPVLDISFSEYLSVHQPYLTSDQIDNLIQQEFTFGVHSATHLYYPDLTEEMQIEQTLNCIQFMTEKFKIKENLFSFPYTDFEIKKSFFDAIKNEVELSFGTANLKLDEIETNFQRIPMEIWDRKSARSIVKSEYVYFIIKMMLGKQIIHRS
jgi:peptidoglycan/xylan/chitin deacetylase (PgdA/CDA1 family)